MRYKKTSVVLLVFFITLLTSKCQNTPFATIKYVWNSALVYISVFDVNYDMRQKSSTVYGVINIDRLWYKEGYLDINCFPIAINGLVSDKIYIDSNMSVSSRYPIKKGEAEIKVYWVFNKTNLLSHDYLNLDAVSTSVLDCNGTHHFKENQGVIYK